MIKNKRETQSLKKAEHKRKLQEDKKNKRKSEPLLDRKEEEIEQKPQLLIVCEGKNTEPDYFKQFRISTIDLEIVGTGRNTVSLVDQVSKILKKSKPRKFYDEVWCVFDADPKPNNPKQLENFNNAIFKANKLGYKVAYSHQAFEYWLLLHFNDHQGGGMDRSLYKDALNKSLKSWNLKYDNSKDPRGKSISKDIFDILMAKDKGKRRVIHAIERAERNFKQLDHSNPANTESSTSVYKLVKKILGIEDEN